MKHSLSPSLSYLITHLIFSVCSASPEDDKIWAPEFVGQSQLSQEYFIFSVDHPKDQFEGFPTCRHGARQTPIDISDPISKSDAKLDLSRNYYDSLTKIALNNNGHYPQVTPFPDIPKRYVNFNGHEYVFEQFHFHSGSSNVDGSDHSIFGHKYPLEVHFVHYMTKYDTLRDALEYENGVLIIAALFEIGHPNDHLDFVVNNIANIALANETLSVKTGVSITDLLPKDKRFYFYEGSLDAPPCQESVTWIVMDAIQTLSDQQMECFRNILRTPTGFVEYKSWRFLQHRNHREIFASDNVGVLSKRYDLYEKYGHGRRSEHYNQRPHPVYKSEDYEKEYDSNHDHNNHDARGGRRHENERRYDYDRRPNYGSKYEKYGAGYEGPSHEVKEYKKARK